MIQELRLCGKHLKKQVTGKPVSREAEMNLSMIFRRWWAATSGSLAEAWSKPYCPPLVVIAIASSSKTKVNSKDMMTLLPLYVFRINNDFSVERLDTCK
jgi:hypothetical protein